MEESSQNVYKRLIRSFVREFYGDVSYAIVNYLMEQEYRVSRSDLYNLFGYFVNEYISALVRDNLIVMSTDNLVKADMKGSDIQNEFGKKSQNYSYYIDYPKILNIIEYTINDIIEKYNDSLIKKEPSYRCDNGDCKNNDRTYTMSEFMYAKKCPICGCPLVLNVVTFKTNFVEYLAPFIKMIEKSKECEKFDVVKPFTRRQESGLLNSRDPAKKGSGGPSFSAGPSERQSIEVEMKYEDEEKEVDALAMNQGSRQNKEKIPWLTKGYIDIIQEHIKQEREASPVNPPGSRPPPDSPVEKKKIKLEKQEN